MCVLHESALCHAHIRVPLVCPWQACLPWVSHSCGVPQRDQACVCVCVCRAGVCDPEWPVGSAHRDGGSREACSLGSLCITKGDSAALQAPPLPHTGLVSGGQV